jgi:hypothetical protein
VFCGRRSTASMNRFHKVLYASFLGCRPVSVV